MRRFPPPWTVEAIDAGFKIIDSNKQSIAHVYGHAGKRNAETAKGESREVWMLHRICLIAGIVSTLMFMTPAVAHEYGVQGHHGQRYGHVHAHRYYVLRRGGGLFGCRHWSPIGWYWTCYFW
jgi:hypothetical protein